MGLSDTSFLMQVTLQTAVPMWLRRLEGLPEGTAIQWAHEAADVVASRGDVLQYGGGKTGEVAKAFNAMARGIAGLATAPGGVCFLGILWCAAHYPGGISATGGETICPRCLADPAPEPPDGPALGEVRDTITTTIRSLTPDRRYL